LVNLFIFAVLPKRLDEKVAPALSEFRRGIGLLGSSSVRLLRSERDE